MSKFAHLAARSRWWLTLLVTVMLCVLPHTDSRANTADREAVIKATFIERFAAFVEWPTGHTPKTYHFCAAGPGEVSEALRRGIPRLRIREKPATYRRLGPDLDVKGCHVLYIPKTDLTRLRQLIAKADKHKVLTISDTTGFGREGVIFNLYRHGRYVRFELNLFHAKRAGLRIPARLSRLARRVTTR